MEDIPADGLLRALIMERPGHWREIGWPEIDAWQPESGLLWLHFHPQAEGSGRFLREVAIIDPVLVDSLLDDDNQPRLVTHEEGMAMTLRGVNLNPGADPDDMVFVNLWIDSTRIITLRSRSIATLRDIRERSLTGKGPKSSGDFLCQVAQGISQRVDPVMERMETQLDEMESRILKRDTGAPEAALPDIRHSILELRSHLTPQARVMEHLAAGPVSWLEKGHKRSLRDVEQEVRQFVNELNDFREQALLLQDEIDNQLARQMNSIMYRLTVVTGIFLPLSFLTGLLGINVGGMPGTENPWAFWLVVGLCVVLAGGGFLLVHLRRLL